MNKHVSTTCKSENWLWIQDRYNKKKNIVYPPIHYDYELKKKTLEIQDWPRESVEDLGGLEARGCAHFTKKRCWLVVWNMNGLIVPYIGNFIIPTDKLHHYSEGLVETTKQMAISWGYSRMSSCYNGIVWHCIPNCRILQDKNGGVP
jgi:hypothetical protein